MVSDLIDVEDKGWNFSLLKRVFLPFEAEIIGGIPLSTQLPKDNKYGQRLQMVYFWLGVPTKLLWM